MGQMHCCCVLEWSGISSAKCSLELFFYPFLLPKEGISTNFGRLQRYNKGQQWARPSWLNTTHVGHSMWSPITLKKSHF